MMTLLFENVSELQVKSNCCSSSSNSSISNMGARAWLTRLDGWSSPALLVVIPASPPPCRCCPRLGCINIQSFYMAAGWLKMCNRIVAAW